MSKTITISDDTYRRITEYIKSDETYDSVIVKLLDYNDYMEVKIPEYLELFTNVYQGFQKLNPIKHNP